ncbi:CDP-alcohol phosphatidyltransferase family protein [Caballeronia sordidicola]|uniref:CDP-alcohol phosphatidyltransferase family protein n=2 Tax=Burkholderiaceae TaxID=119060 RepID=A0A158F127_CABSO|nr:CDP-alcohol phosphatidyltransferase family protein [Caballeronia sordidicola]
MAWAGRRCHRLVARLETSKLPLKTSVAPWPDVSGVRTKSGSPLYAIKFETRYISRMNNPRNATLRAAPEPATWDARLARRLVTPLVGTPITPNHLTTLRLLIGMVGAYYLSVGSFWTCSLGALLIAVSNFVDHTDGELARISGQSSKIGHFYDLACDSVVTVALFVGLGFYVGVHHPSMIVPAQWLGGVAGVAVALIFFLRMRIESMAGKNGTKQASVAGFETEDVLYLLPFVTLFNGMTPFLVAASIGAPLFAVWVVVDYQRVVRRVARSTTSSKDADGQDLQAVQ